MDEYMLYKEEKRLCEKYGASSLKEVLQIQKDMIRDHYQKVYFRQYQ